MARPRNGLDAGNGAWSELGPALFEALGFRVHRLFCAINGAFPNRPPDCARAGNAPGAPRTAPAPPPPPAAPPPASSVQRAPDKNGLLEHKYYTNSSGQRIHAPAHTQTGDVPPGASAQCRDGSYSFSTHRRGTCSRHGGVAEWLGLAK